MSIENVSDILGKNPGMELVMYWRGPFDHYVEWRPIPGIDNYKEVIYFDN